MSDLISGTVYVVNHRAYPYPNAWGLHCEHAHRDEENARECLDRLGEDYEILTLDNGVMPWDRGGRPAVVEAD